MTLKSSEPEAYEIGYIPFLGATIWLDSRPLIPRVETEYWVEQFATMQPSGRALDLFAGSGCIGIAILKRTNMTVDFGEKEERHLSTIERNIRENGIDQRRAHVIQTDVWSRITRRYDYVLANPPYLSRSRMDRVQRSVLEHEPNNALFAGDDGFELIGKTISGLPAHLVSGGQCWIEHEPEHIERIASTATPLGLRTKTHKDQYGVERYSVILKP